MCMLDFSSLLPTDLSNRQKPTSNSKAKFCVDTGKEIKAYGNAVRLHWKLLPGANIRQLRCRAGRLDLLWFQKHPQNLKKNTIEKYFPRKGSPERGRKITHSLQQYNKGFNLLASAHLGKAFQYRYNCAPLDFSRTACMLK